MPNDAQKPPHSEKTRTAIRDQLAHLVREAGALEAVIERVPDELLTERPPDGGWTLKEAFALLARWDEAVYPRWLERIAGEDEPHLDLPDEEALLADDDWNAHAVTDLLKRVKDARRAFMGALEALPPRMWKREARFGDDGSDRRDVYALAHDAARRDYHRLRRMTRRLHQSNLSAQGHDVPR